MPSGWGFGGWSDASQRREAPGPPDEVAPPALWATRRHRDVALADGEAPEQSVLDMTPAQARAAVYGEKRYSR
jgi:hypothetical protein